MSEFIIREEGFKLGWAEKVPSPQEGECFLLCQSGAGEQSSKLISYGVKYSSANIRHGHYNQKITLSLEEKNFNQNYIVVMRDTQFHFNVTVKMSYVLQDAQQYFFQGKMEEEDVGYTVKRAIRQQDERWDAWEDVQLQNALEYEIEEKLRQYKGVRFRGLQVSAVPEEAAAKIRDSNKKKTVGMHVSQNDTDEKIARNEQSERIADSEQRLKMKQIDDMAIMWQNFGNMGSVVNEYLKGNMDGKEFYEYLMRARSEKLGILQTAVSGDMLTQKEIMEKINEIFTDNEFRKMADVKQLQGGEVNKLEEKNTENVDNTEESAKEKLSEAEPTQEKAAFVDGDYIV